MCKRVYLKAKEAEMEMQEATERRIKKNVGETGGI